MLFKRLPAFLIASVMVLTLGFSGCKDSEAQRSSGDTTPIPTALETPKADLYEAADENEKLVVDFFKRMSDGKYDELAGMVAPEERDGYEAIAAMPDGDRTGIRNISSITVKQLTPYELSDSVIFSKALEKYAGIDGARIAYRVKVDISVYDDAGSYSDEKGESEQIVLLVKSEGKWFVGFWGAVND